MSSDDTNQTNLEDKKTKIQFSKQIIIMLQIGWFELLIVVLVAILVIGPKDFPIVLRKSEVG